MSEAFLFSFALVTVASWTAVAADLRDIDRYVRAEMELNQIPGLSLVVVRGGEVLTTRAYGVKSLANGEPMTVDTPVELASVSKSLTALAVLQLERAGRVELDRPVIRYLPEFRTSDPAASSRITVRHLLRHTSGLSRRNDYLVPCCGRAGENDLNVAVRKLEAARLRRAPGAAFLYANSNYVLLAALIERVSGLPFPDYMQNRVFQPLGMMRTTLDRERARAWGLAEPHEREWGRVRPSGTDFAGWYGASQVKSTADDMGRYLSAVLRRMDGPSRLQPPYDMGWFVRPRAGWLGNARVLEHTGDIRGGNTAVIVAPELGLGVAVLLNAGVSRAGEIARGVLARVCSFPAPEPGVPTWSKNPDNWAICFTLAAGLVLAALTIYLTRARAQFRRGERKFSLARDWWAAARALLLTGLAVYLVYLLLGGSKPPVVSLPSSLRVGIFLLGGVTAALLVSTAILGLAPRRERP